VGDTLERRTVIVPVNVRRPPPARGFFRRHPAARAFAVTVAFAVVLAVIGALVNSAISHIPGGSPGSNPLVPVLAPGGGVGQGALPSGLSSTVPPAPAYQVGSCVSGDFSGTTPKDVSGESCSSGGAEYEVIREIPGATDPNVCNGVKGALQGFLEEWLENGAVVSRTVYCLGRIVQ
jgi:hypothetical protein